MRHAGAALIGAALLFMVLLIGPAVLPAAFRGLPGAGPGIALAASPEPSAGAGDTRSTGEAPGFVGSPILAVAAVLGLGAAAVLATVGYVRLTGGPGRRGRSEDLTRRP